MKEKQELVVSWDKGYVKSVKKDAFIKAHLHLADEATLSKEYDKIVPPKG